MQKRTSSTKAARVFHEKPENLCDTMSKTRYPVHGTQGSTLGNSPGSLGEVPCWMGYLSRVNPLSQVTRLRREEAWACRGWAVERKSERETTHEGTSWPRKINLQLVPIRFLAPPNQKTAIQLLLIGSPSVLETRRQTDKPAG